MPMHTFLKKCFALLCLCSFTFSTIVAQCDCAYPVIMIHGWTGDYTSFDPLYTDADFMTAWGGLTDTHDAVLNATTQSNAFGTDDTKYTPDDDVLVEFINDSNNVAPGCIYALDFSWYWNEVQNSPEVNTNSVPSGESDSNQSSVKKQGWAVGEAIKKVLAANPTKKKVILMGHSMGGLASREYLQRVEGGAPHWWVDPADPVDGHKVAKLITLGTPHRGSRASVAGLGGFLGFDETSEAVRDLRPYYACGFLGLSNCRAPYLYGGPEDDNVDAGYFKSSDVDCDGDYDTDPIVPINEVGAGDPWDGTKDNPNMPLPTNVRYSYYTSSSSLDAILFQFNGGDGVVPDERQWIYMNGNGSSDDYIAQNSIPVPHDGTDYRLSDRVHSTGDIFHTSQTGDVENVLRCMDEADYPIFAYDVNTMVDYAAFAQIRADYVPMDSEYTDSANNTIDGDWYKVENPADADAFDIIVTPHPNLAGRVDFYETAPTDYDNTNAAASMTWSVGQATPITLNVANMTYASGTYYMRITHDNTTNDSWRTPYKFRIEIQEATCPAIAHYGDNPIIDGTYQVAQLITADGTVGNTGNVVFYAGDCIELQEGFTVDMNAEFLAAIQGCAPLAPTNDPTASLTTNDEKNNNGYSREVQLRRIPQPDGTVIVEYYVPLTGVVAISFLDEVGKIINTIVDNEFVEGAVKHTFTLDANALVAGTYAIKLNYLNKEKIVKIIKRPEEEIRSWN